MIVEPDFLGHWKTKLLITLVAEAAVELCRQQEITQREASGQLGETHGGAWVSGGFGVGSPWGNPRAIQPEASPLWLLRLWAHCQLRKAWIFAGMTPVQLRSICEAPLPPERWRDILLECRFIETDGSQITVHEWDAVNWSLIRNWTNGKKGGRPPKGKETREEPTGNPRGTDRSDRSDRGDGDTTRARARGADSAGESSGVGNRSFEDQISEAQKKVCGVLGGRRKTLGDLGLRALGALIEGGDLPMADAEWETLTWFYGLPSDEEDVDLRGRYRDGDKLAQNLMTALERAHFYAKKIGRGAGARTAIAEKKAAPADPAGWREWFAEVYPNGVAPGAFAELPADIRAEFEGRAA